jgi:thymidylate kinase
MPFISILGCDGSGKSAVIQNLADLLASEAGTVVRGHWRPKAFVSENDDKALATADDPHGQTPRGLVTSLLKLLWLWLNWWLGWWISLRSARNHGYVLFDRYHGDLLVDPRRYRYGGPMWAARLAVRCMPQPDLVIFLDAEPEVLLSRKQEVSREALVASRSRYLALCESNPNCRIVDAAQSLPAVVTDVLSHIRQLT